MISGSRHKPQQWTRKQTYSHATVKTKGRCWHAEQLWIIPSRGSLTPSPLSFPRSSLHPSMHCVPLGIQIVQIVCECELSTVFNFGSPQCLVSASLRRAVPCHMQQSLRRPKPQCTLTVPTGGGGMKILHYYYVYTLWCSESVSRVWQVNRLTNYQAQSQQSGNVTQMRWVHASPPPGLGLGRARVLLACPAAMQMPKMRVHSLWSLGSRCLRLFNSHTCSISQCNHKFWLNYRIKMFVLNLKMCVRVQHSVCSTVLLFSATTSRLAPAPQGCLRCNRWQLIRGARRRRRPWPQSPYLTSKQGRTRLHVQLSARRI